MPDTPDRIPDPFRDHRRADGVHLLPSDGEQVPMILRHEDVRRAAKDWQTYSSDAPFRVPIPSEEDVRSVRQLPIEVDPPDHADYRKLVEPFFMRAKEPEFVARIETLVDDMLTAAMARESIEAVHEFALPLQSRALAVLLDVPQAEADVWIGWGIHVFHEEDGTKIESKGAVLEDYLNARFDQAAAQPGDDFFSLLTTATFRGRPLTRAEMLGFANLTFAGGRDTVIYTVACALAHLARHPEALDFLRADPRRIIYASEEYFRVFMPLTHIGRVCPVDTNVHGVDVPAGGRVSLCWASANLDEEAFPAADEVHLDRKPNPHVAFGFGAHLCLGAPHARTVLRALLARCCARVGTMTILSAVDRVERTAGYERQLGFDSLVLRIAPPMPG
jgi:cytochrome P450